MAQRLSAACKRLEWEKRLTVFIRALDHGPTPGPRGGVSLECVVTGVDKAGIVARVARTLADLGVNVTDLRSEVRPEPESGTPLYTMRLRMTAPAELARRELLACLDRVAAELRVDLVVRDASD